MSDDAKLLHRLIAVRDRASESDKPHVREITRTLERSLNMMQLSREAATAVLTGAEPAAVRARMAQRRKKALSAE